MERILLVDHERALRAALAAALRQDGFEVLAAESGEQALELADHTPFDLVVTGLRMQGMDGLDLFRRIRERQSAVAGVVITAYGSLETAVEAMRLGVADYLTKPFRVAELRRVVARVLAGRRPASRGACPFALAAMPHELLTAPGERRWMHDLWSVGAGRRGVLLAAEPPAGREVMRALFRAEAAHRARPRSVVARVAEWLGHDVDAFFAVVDIAGRVLRFAGSGGVEARICGSPFGPDVLTGRHDDIGVAIENTDVLVASSADAVPVSDDGDLAGAAALRAGACLRVGLGELVRAVEEETLTLRPPCAPDDYVERTAEVAQQAGLAPDDAFRVATAVAEAVQNAEHHAYDGGRGLIEVRYLWTGDDLVVQVSDTGRGFDPEAADPVLVGTADLYRESGRGFLMMRRLMDAVEVDSAAGRGTTIRMEKGRSDGDRA